MVSSRGPLPKRAMERRRRNVSGDVDRIQVVGHVPVPSAPREWDPIARRMFRSLRQSGQSLLYEPSDWAAAYLAGEATTLMLVCPGAFTRPGARHRKAGACPVCTRAIALDEEGRFGQHRRPTLRAEMLQAVWKMWIDLNITETARRRARIEIDRVTSLDSGPAKVSALDEYRQSIAVPADDLDDADDDDEGDDEELDGGA